MALEQRILKRVLYQIPCPVPKLEKKEESTDNGINLGSDDELGNF